MVRTICAPGFRHPRQLGVSALLVVDVVGAVVGHQEIEAGAPERQGLGATGEDVKIGDAPDPPLGAHPLQSRAPGIERDHLARNAQALAQLHAGKTAPGAHIEHPQLAAELHDFQQLQSERCRPQRQVVDHRDQIGIGRIELSARAERHGHP